MKLEFTPALERAFDLARHVAVRDGSATIAPRHLLAAMLAEEEGKAAALLLNAGIDWPRLQTHFGLPIDAATEAMRLPMHDSFQSILLRARELTASHGDEGSVSTDHMLLAILTVGATLREELAELGLDFARLQHGIVGDVTPLVLDEPLDLREPTEEVNVGRILDANANRGSEKHCACWKTMPASRSTMRSCPGD